MRHEGGINGFNSVLSWLPESGLRVAVISNSKDDAKCHSRTAGRRFANVRRAASAAHDAAAGL